MELCGPTLLWIDFRLCCHLPLCLLTRPPPDFVLLTFAALKLQKRYIRSSLLELSVHLSTPPLAISTGSHLLFIMKSQQEHKVIYFRSLENFKVDVFCLKLSTLSRCCHIVERIVKYLGLNECPKMRLTSHNPYADKPNSRPARHCDMLSDMCKTSDILYYELLGSHSLPSHLSRALNISFNHATKNEVLIRCVSTVHHRTVSDLLNEMKSEVQQFNPSAELRLLEIDHNRISKIYPLSEKIKNLKNQTWPLRIEKIPEEEKNLGLDDKIIHVCHFTREPFPGKRNQLDVRYFGEPFFLIIHKGETLAEIKLRIKEKLQVPDDEFSKEYLGLEHFHNCLNTTFATNQLEEDEMLVQHSGHVAGPQLIETGQAQLQNTVNYQTLKDPTSTRFTWTVENFSRLNNKEHYSNIFLVGCYKWRIMIFPKGNNVDHFSVYLNTAESFSQLYAEFSLVVVNQTHKKNSLRKDARHQFTPGQSSGVFASFVPLSELNNPERSCETIGVVEEASKETQKVEQVPEPAASNAGVTDEPSTHSGKDYMVCEHPLAGQLYQDGKYSQYILDGNFEDIGGFSILKTHASLYRQIWLKYGHIASSHAPPSSYSVQVTLVTDIMTNIMDMCHCRLSEMSSLMVAKWENNIKMAETLHFNVKWLRERFDDVKKVFYEFKNKSTVLLEKTEALQAAEARLMYAENELKKARDNISFLETERNVLGKGWPFTF
ncbi:hypothetical protein C5167_001986 [Papaver somniferum]|uniref:ubiquitinyl hydrolase 1 n=1 Tax=Papaver somniferum TaxID=3469 RepID=A0A4Y7KYE7_PAPSO|nr:hypothetical protein C5167_001986 [Papaver somniferum]